MGYSSVADNYIFICVAIIVSQIREITQNFPTIRIYNSSRSSKIIDLDVNQEYTCNFLLVIAHISYSFRDIDA